MFTRPEFDHELLARLPGAKPTRKERADGWEDTLRINILTISIRVWTKGSGLGFARKTSGTVRAEIRSVRVAVDGSETLTWASQDRHHQGLVLVLDALKVQFKMSSTYEELFESEQKVRTRIIALRPSPRSPFASRSALR